jgi:hypothetical protein
MSDPIEQTENLLMLSVMAGFVLFLAWLAYQLKDFFGGGSGPGLPGLRKLMGIGDSGGLGGNDPTAPYVPTSTQVEVAYQQSPMGQAVESVVGLFYHPTSEPLTLTHPDWVPGQPNFTLPPTMEDLQNQLSETDPNGMWQ